VDLLQGMHHALRQHSSKRPGQDGGVELVCIRGESKLLETDLVESDKAPVDDALAQEAPTAESAAPVEESFEEEAPTPETAAALMELCLSHPDELTRVARDNGILLVFDEVQSGLGRPGSLWAYQSYGVRPDILTAAKPLAGGLPMGAVLMTQAVADVMHPGDHGSTFAAGPLIASVAEAVLDRISAPAFLAEVAAKGAYLKERLEEINSPHITAVRGRGLMIGADLDVPAVDVVNSGYRHGLLLVNAGPNTLRLIPPLVITREEIDLLIERLTTVLTTLDS